MVPVKELLNMPYEHLETLSFQHYLFMFLTEGRLWNLHLISLGGGDNVQARSVSRVWGSRSLHFLWKQLEDRLGILINMLTWALHLRPSASEPLKLEYLCFTWPHRSLCQPRPKSFSERSHALGALPSYSTAASAALVSVIPQDVVLGRMMEFSAVL